MDAPFQARENVGIVAARGRMLSSVRPLMRQEDSRRPVWEFACRSRSPVACSKHSGKPWLSQPSAEHRDVAILRSLPGIGRINLATLLSEASGPLSRRDYQALRTLSGVAPVTKRSGKSHVVVMRYASHVRLRNTVYHWARVATQHDHESRTRYAALRRRGHSHGRAIRGVADRLLAVACVLLQRQTLFDPHFRQATAS